MKTPSVTPVQFAAFATWAASQAVAFGWITSTREQLLLSVSSTVIAVALKAADAFIRFGRSKLAVELAAEGFQLNLHSQNSRVQYLESELSKAQAIVDALKGVSSPTVPPPAAAEPAA